MLDHLRQRVREALASVHFVTLSTYGPAELQASHLPCELSDLRLYLLLPTPSDHLLNLENKPEVMVTAAEWQLRGRGVILDKAACPLELGLLGKPEAQWSCLVEIRPLQLNIRRRNGWGYSETIDFEE